jgi:hypothetical protein
MKQDGSTQTTPTKDTKFSHEQHRQRKKDFVKEAIEKEMPKITQASRTIKRATRRGTWDGSVVEEVFLEMTGVTIGDEGKMKSHWNN